MRKQWATVKKLFVAMLILTSGVLPIMARQSANKTTYSPGQRSLIESSAMVSEGSINQEYFAMTGAVASTPISDAVPVKIYWTDGGTRKIQRAMEAYLAWIDAGYIGYAWYTDTVDNSYIAPVTEFNSFYEVYGNIGGLLLGPSNRIGVIDFAIAPGNSIP